MRRPLVIYDFATAPLCISLYIRKIWFLFYQCRERHKDIHWSVQSWLTLLIGEILIFCLIGPKSRAEYKNTRTSILPRFLHQSNINMQIKPYMWGAVCSKLPILSSFEKRKNIFLALAGPVNRDSVRKKFQKIACSSTFLLLLYGMERPERFNVLRR